MCTSGSSSTLTPVNGQQEIPIRQPVLLPDNGDVSVVAGLKNRNRLTQSAMILSNQSGSLGAPRSTAPLGASKL